MFESYVKVAHSKAQLRFNSLTIGFESYVKVAHSKAGLIYEFHCVAFKNYMNPLI